MPRQRIPRQVRLELDPQTGAISAAHVDFRVVLVEDGEVVEELKTKTVDYDPGDPKFSTVMTGILNASAAELIVCQRELQRVAKELNDLKNSRAKG